MLLAVTLAQFPADLETVRSLFREYSDGLAVDLCTQNFEAELAGLPGKYAAPGGCVLLAWERETNVAGPEAGTGAATRIGAAQMEGAWSGKRGSVADGATPVGCVALRPLDDGTCEMKRLYVRPIQRGTGAGRMLVTRLMAEARARGYPALRLDTIPSLMPEAMGLYRQFGFVETQPYWNNVLPGVAYLERRL